MSFSDFTDNLHDFNARCIEIVNHLNNKFNLGFKFDPVNLKQPKFYNSFYDAYLRDSKRLIVQRFNKLSQDIQNKNLIGPVSIYSANWKEVDSALKKIEKRVKKY